jgi:hypothetical protein
MIILITYTDKKDNSARVSHGVDSETLQIVPLPNEHLGKFNAVFLTELGEWIIL